VEYVQIKVPCSQPLRASRLGFGCEPLGGYDWGHVDFGEIAASVNDALDSGWTYFDTAATYALGASECRLGDVLGVRKRSVVIGTKAGIGWAPGEQAGGRARTSPDGRPDAIRASVEGSLQRLRIETIPLIFLHYPDPSVPVEESMGALEDLRRAGKVGAIGVSNFTVDLLERARREVWISAVQLECSFLNLRGARESSDPLKWCNANGIPVIAYGVLARGLLTDKYGPEQPAFSAGDRRGRLPEFQGEEYARRFNLIRQLRGFAQQLGVPMSALSIRWVLDVLGVDVAITGIKTRRHVRENQMADGWTLPPDVVDTVSVLLARVQSAPLR